MKNFGFFCDFWCQFETFFFQKTAFISSQKPAGQRIRAVLSVLNVLIYEVYQEFDKNWVKTLKIVTILVYCHFQCQFETFSI